MPLENISEPLTAVVSKERSLVSPLVALAKALLPAVEAACQRNSPVGCHRRTKEALKELHSQEKKFVFSDQIMVKDTARYCFLCFHGVGKGRECVFVVIQSSYLLDAMNRN